MKLSTFQNDIIDAFNDTTDNLCIKALAGCAKTSTGVDSRAENITDAERCEIKNCTIRYFRQ